MITLEKWASSVSTRRGFGFPLSSLNDWGLALIYTCLGAFLFVLAYPPWNLGVLTGWMAFIPLLACVAHTTYVRAGMLGWLFGLIANLGVFHWLLAVPGFHWYHFFLLDAYLALYPAVWALLACRFAHGSWMAHLALAGAWVVLDYLRGHAGFLALPWITLAQSQIANLPLLQSAQIFGEPVVTFFVILGNLVLWNALAKKEFRTAWICAWPIITAMALGAISLTSNEMEEHQTIIVGALKTEYPANQVAMTDPTVRFENLMHFLTKETPREVRLIALPESTLINPRRFPAQIDRLQKLAEGRNLTLITGIAENTKFDRPPVDELFPSSALRSGAWVFTPDRQIPEHYEKSRLVPFAEEMPLRQWITWPTWLIPPLPEVARAQSPLTFAIPGNIRVGIMICWESLFSDHARTLIQDEAAILVMLANEGWFTDPASAQHILTAYMRAVETHRPLMISSNMGAPLVIDPFGRRLNTTTSVPGMEWATAPIPLLRESTFYVRHGDVFVFGCGLFLVSIGFFQSLRNLTTRCSFLTRRKKINPHTSKRDLPCGKRSSAW